MYSKKLEFELENKNKMESFKNRMKNLDSFLEKRKSEVPARIEQFISNQVKQVTISIE